MSLLIRRELVERARDFNIILDDVSLTELSFGKEYTAAVEAKQVAQQEAQRAAFYVERAVQEKQQKIVQAEGEAEAAKMISFFAKNYVAIGEPAIASSFYYVFQHFFCTNGFDDFSILFFFDAFSIISILHFLFKLNSQPTMEMISRVFDRFYLIFENFVNFCIIFK